MIMVLKFDVQSETEAPILRVEQSVWIAAETPGF
jgi:hypothetical protein